MPVIVNQEWLDDWVSPLDLDAGFPGYDDIEEARCRVRGCTESEACPEGCSWVEAPDENGLGLCSSCADEEQAA